MKTNTEPVIWSTLVAATAVLWLASCSQSGSDDPGDLDRPLFGSSTETRFFLSPASGEIKIRDAVAVAKVLRRYRDLDAAEKALVKLAVRRHFDGLVALELRKLEQMQVVERERIRRLPDAVARKREDEALSAKLYAQAARSVAARLDGLLAVPVKTATNQSVVAFARIVSDDVRVADAAYELDVPLSKVGPNTKVVADDTPGAPSMRAVNGGGARVAQVVGGPAITIK